VKGVGEGEKIQLGKLRRRKNKSHRKAEHTGVARRNSDADFDAPFKALK